MNCAEQQKTVGLRATRSKALESGSKLLGFQCCEARGQAPPLKVAGVPVRKRCLIASVQYPTSQSKSTRLSTFWISGLAQTMTGDFEHAINVAANTLIGDARPT